MSKTTTRGAAKLTAEICLYGTRDAGFGWLAAFAGMTGKPLGDGALRHDSLTVAVWTAVEALRDAGITDGDVAIYAPGGERVARVALSCVPSFGALVFAPAAVITIEVE